jgi:hypothetical protein
MAWIARLNLTDPARSLRQEATRPPFVRPTFFNDRKSTVDWACRRRHRALGFPQSVPAHALGGGRLLMFAPDDSLSDGAAEVNTNGFFDFDNIPPWDTWVAYLYESELLNYFVSWIPAQLIELADTGIEVNPEACIRWLEELDSPVVTALREESLLS